MKTIITLDRANQPYGYPQLDSSASLHATGSLYGTASFAVSASWAPPSLLGGTQYSVPLWTSATTLGTSSLYESGSVLKSVYGGNDIGLKLDFANEQYYLGDYTSSKGLVRADCFNGSVHLSGDNGTSIQLDGSNLETYITSRYINLSSNDNNLSIIQNGNNQSLVTSYSGSDIGLKLDYANSIYQLGQLTGGNQTKLTIDDPTSTISITGSLIAPSITGSLQGTASFALSASWAPGGDTFPYVGTAEITGSLLIQTGSLNINVAQKLIDLEADIIAFAVAL
jgi:hypothetical protein